MAGSIRTELFERRAVLSVDCPPLNILDLATLAELQSAAEGLAARRDITLIEVRGAGPKAFCAGVSVQDHTPDKVAEMLARFHGALNALRALDAVTLAVVQGHCLGGGMELALACDFVLASEAARFGQPEIELGCYPPYAAALYPQQLGRARTLELLVTGRTLTAFEAKEWGIVTWLAPADGLEARCAEITTQILAKSGAVVRLAKRGVRTGEMLPFAAALAENERIYLEELCATTDMHEGLAAFLEKRRPTYKHQ